MLFSQFKLIKNEKRINLANETLESLMLQNIDAYSLDNDDFIGKFYEYNEQKSSKKRKYSMISPNVLEDKTKSDVMQSERKIKKIED